MARNLSDGIISYRGITARESGSALHKLAVRAYELDGELAERRRAEIRAWMPGIRRLLAAVLGGAALGAALVLWLG